MLEALVNAPIIDSSTLTFPSSITCRRTGPWTAWNPLGDPWESHDHRSMPYQMSSALICSWIRHRTMVVALPRDRKSTRLNSSHVKSSYAFFYVKKKYIKGVYV